MEPKYYYQYPNKRIEVIKGLSPRKIGKTFFNETTWCFTPPKGSRLSPIKNGTSLEEIQILLLRDAIEKGVEIPKSFLEVTEFRFPRITIAENSVKFKCQYVDNGRIKTTQLRFQFHNTVTSFTFAIESALAAKNMWKVLYKESQK